jgi:hypothetical protein
MSGAGATTSLGNAAAAPGAAAAVVSTESELSLEEVAEKERVLHRLRICRVELESVRILQDQVGAGAVGSQPAATRTSCVCIAGAALLARVLQNT